MPSDVPTISTRASAGYIPCFDGLRAIAILVVLASHFEFSRYAPGGFGVTVFFFISGVLITRLLLAEQMEPDGIRVGAFYVRRFWRLLPPLILMIAVTGPAWVALGNSLSPHAALSALFYYRNYYQHYDRLLHGHSTSPHWEQLWSLSIEEHFYLVFPILICLFGRRIRLMLGTLAVLCVCPLVLRCIYCAIPIPLADHYCYHATETRLDAILSGCLLSLLAHYFGSAGFWAAIRAPILLYLCSLGLIGAMLLREPFYDAAIKYSVQQVLLFVIIYQLLFTDAHQWIKNVLENPLLKYLGRISYSLYLWHLACFVLITQAADSKSWRVKLVVVIVSLAVSMASYHCVERPLQALRKRAGNARQPDSVPSADLAR
jgi:peptidoglycan/LPS O-acetylase OafA/YrhL